jgi:hypothetical protein
MKHAIIQSAILGNVGKRRKGIKRRKSNKTDKAKQENMRVVWERKQ